MALGTAQVPVEPIFLLRQQVMQDRKMVKMGHRQEPFTSEPAFGVRREQKILLLTVIVGRCACRQPGEANEICIRKDETD